MWINNLSIGKRLYAGFALAAACFIVLLVFANINFGKLLQATSWNTRSYDVVSEADGILLALVNIETGERGYALTGNQSSLDPYKAGLAAFGRHMARAKALTADNPLQQARLRDIDERQQQWVKNALEPVLELRRAAITAPAKMADVVAFVQLGKCSSAMAAMRARLDEFAGEEKALQATRAADVEALVTLMQGTLLLGGLVAAALAGVLAVAITRSVQAPMRHVLHAIDELHVRDGNLPYPCPCWRRNPAYWPGL